jgi:hypothetical protein
VKKALLALLSLVVGLAAVLVARAAMLPAPDGPAPASDAVAVDTAVAAQRLAEAVRFATVSYASGAPIDTAAFLGFHDFLARAFPQAHATLTRERIGGLSLLYTWKGKDTTAAPVILMGHMDVVPVPEPNLTEWTHAPFSGAIADGYVWGRGTLDDKTTVLSTLEAVEGLVAQGFVPSRTVYLTFGHDEEVGGRYGARAIVAELVRRGVKPALVIDEGGFMASGVMPGIEGRAAIVGIAEKGYLSLRLTAKAQGRSLVDADGADRGRCAEPRDRRARGQSVPALARRSHARHARGDGALLGIRAEGRARQSLAHRATRRRLARQGPARRGADAHDHLADHARRRHQGQRPAARGVGGGELPHPSRRDAAVGDRLRDARDR